ncbi:MAG: hypothetical protein H6581_00050 [Bacteroidia bacterium]|nr:hypothetical protein [Bacteroidia bacterium]
MQRILILSVSLFVIFFLGWTFKTADTEGGKPEKVAKAFLIAMEKGDLVKAKEYSTQQTQDQMIYLTDAAENAKNRKVIITGSRIRDGYGQVYYSFKEDKDKEYVIGLMEVDGKWLVETDKTAMKDGKAAPDASQREQIKKYDNYDTSPWNTPEEVASGFLKAIEDDNWVRANALSTDKTRESLSTLEDLGTPPKYRGVEILSSDQEDKTAVVYYRYDDSEMERSIELIRLGKAWRVETTKSELLKKDESEEDEYEPAYGGDDSDDNDWNSDEITEEERAEIENYDISTWQTPKEVATGFLQAVEYQNWVQAKALSTEKTWDELSKLASVTPEAKKRKFTINRVTPYENNTQVYYTFAGETEEKVISLVKIGDLWKVETTKLDMNGDGGLKDNLDSLQSELEKGIKD